jgi:hypothetical protein
MHVARVHAEDAGPETVRLCGQPAERPGPAEQSPQASAEEETIR